MSLSRYLENKGTTKKELLRSIGTIAGSFIGVIGLTALGTKGCNMACNDREILKKSYKTLSYSTGLAGHVEYTKYNDSSQDVKVYPDFGHRIFSSELDQDLNGDGLVDRIRLNSGELKMNKLNEILIRQYDYESYRKEFEKADLRLQELMKKYP